MKQEFIELAKYRLEKAKNTFMFDRRQKGDYKDFMKFEKEDVKEWLKKAEDFIDKIESLTMKIIEEEQNKLTCTNSTQV